jgi:LysR family hydrogen peroxide-inducible transcriptional activator
MNIQQLQYIVAVDQHRHFQKAADACFVTPATLSMMVKKLEQELNIIIFDRSRQPVLPTELGVPIIEKAKAILFHIEDLIHTAQFAKDEVAGELRVAIIPTLAPYLIHLFLPSLMENYPLLKLKLFEWNTDQIIEGLTHNRIDIGIAATPLHHSEIKETLLFEEQLLAYSCGLKKSRLKKYLTPEDIDLNRLWLLEEDHCLRSQVLNLCSLKKKQLDKSGLEFEAGSIETLLNIVSINEGITIIPEMVLQTLPADRLKHIRFFAEPAPVRAISMLTYRHFMKMKMAEALQSAIVASVKPILKKNKGETQIIEITRT